MYQRLYQVVVFVKQPEGWETVEFALQHHSLRDMSAYLAYHRPPNSRVLWSRV